MKKSAIILLLFILSVGLFANSRIDNLFQEALTDFESRDYQNALEKFRSIENEDIINADLFYNIGNCYFRLNEIGKSILYFRKALKVKSNHEPARRNLEFVLSFTKDKQESGSEDVIRSFWKRLFDSFSINLLAVITIIIFS
ncbi:MAG: tetratricopeptide repeat protein, partial [Candidatus Cloacimonetes bacterium]|nr:tetratricopeptide repeat protein [Candidatus Cloacimonadota bacterium]